MSRTYPSASLISSVSSYAFSTCPSYILPLAWHNADLSLSVHLCLAQLLLHWFFRSSRRLPFLFLVIALGTRAAKRRKVALGKLYYSSITTNVVVLPKKLNFWHLTGSVLCKRTDLEIHVGIHCSEVVPIFRLRLFAELPSNTSWVTTPRDKKCFLWRLCGC